MRILNIIQNLLIKIKYIFIFNISIKIPKQIIQSQVSKNFPQTHEKMGASITLSDPNIFLKEGSNSICIKISIKAKIPLIGEKNGFLIVSSGINYDQKMKSIHTENIKLNDLQIENTGEQITSKIKSLADMVIRKTLEGYKIYQGESSVANGTLKEINVRNGQVILTIGR